MLEKFLRFEPEAFCSEATWGYWWGWKFLASHSVVDVGVCPSHFVFNFLHLKSKKSKIKYPKSIKINFSKSFKHKPSQTCSTGTLYTPRFPFFQGRKLTTKWVPKSLLQNAKKMQFLWHRGDWKRANTCYYKMGQKKLTCTWKHALEKIFVALC